MAAHSRDRAVLIRAMQAMLQANGVLSDAARIVGIPRQTLHHQVTAAKAAGITATTPERDFETPELPSEDTPAEEIIARREAIWHRRKASADAKRCISVKVNIDGPIGIACFGDPHVDNPGQNFPLFRAHTELVMKTEGMIAGCVGDLQDSWIGRLARLWANQGVTAREAWKLVEWWVSVIGDKLLFVVEGNHDSWAHGVNNVSLVDWIVSRAGGVSDNDGVRLGLDLPSGLRITINARHDFAGRSQYNKAHGLTKAALFGWKDDFMVAGHIHTSGYNPIKNQETGRGCHPIRIASYKHLDEYSKERGDLDENLFECPVLMIDPYEKDPRHQTWVEFDPFRAAKVLKALRADWKRSVR